MKNLFCYHTDNAPLQMVPARSNRAWMDATGERFAYRCLPLSMANSTGWELLCPVSFEATWNGGVAKEDITLRPLDDGQDLARVALSHFGTGILTFHTGWLFRTPPGWALLAHGAPNWPKAGIGALAGLVETDWLPFPFTMNWMFTAPGTVRFEKGEPICFIMPVPHKMMNDIQPVVAPLASNPELQEQYLNWNKSRGSFLEKLEGGDPDTKAQGWQRFYMQGKNAEGVKTEAMHLSKRVMKGPRAKVSGDVLE